MTKKFLKLRKYPLEFLKLNSLVLGCIIIILIILAIAMGVVSAKKVQVKAKISATIVSAPAKDLNAIVIYPNPVRGNQKIIFANLTKDVQIQIFNIAGEKVFDIRNIDGRFSWNTRNFDNNKCASGIYLCVIENKRGEKKIKKIAVIR